MRAYQQHATTALADCCTLIPVGIPAHTTTLQVGSGQAPGTGAERFAVPHSPGRARRFSPYLRGRRRGRR